MRRDLLRRIERLEKRRCTGFPNKLRTLALRLGGDPQQYRRVVQGYERELNKHLELNGITLEGLRILDDLLRRDSGLPPRPPGEFG